MSNQRIAWLQPSDPPTAFPPVETALVEPDGLLAAGGDLSSERLVEAYTRGIFPWFDAGQPILWWSPDPRCVLDPRAYHMSRRFRRSLKASRARVSFNRAFDAVIDGCAAPRDGQPGTWITAEMRVAYRALHRAGFAHSVEVANAGRLIGGLYGLAIGGVFFAESMYSAVSGASKIALAGLCRVLADRGFAIIDCQMTSAHLQTLGATLIPRRRFIAILAAAARNRRKFAAWPSGTLGAAELR